MITLLTQVPRFALTVAMPIFISLAGHGQDLAARFEPAPSLVRSFLHQSMGSLAAALQATDAQAPVAPAAPNEPRAAKSAIAPAKSSAPASQAAAGAPAAKTPSSPPPPDAKKPAPAKGETEAGKEQEGKSAEDAESEGSLSSDESVEAEAEGEPSSGLNRSSTPVVSFGGSDVLVPAGEYHAGDLVNFGGHVTVEGEVHGSVIVIGGVLELSGSVRGDVVAIGSRANLREGAKVRGEVVNVGGTIHRSSNVAIRGQYTSVDFVDFGRFATGHGPARYFAYLFFWLALIVTAVRFLGVIVVAAVAPQRVEGAIAQPRPSWILAFLLGLAVRIFAGILIFILIIGCVTIPVAVALWIISRILIWMGIASISLHVGRRIGKSVFGADLSYFGAILTGFLVYAILSFIPIVGFFASAVISCTGLGLMLLTRFGGKKPAGPVIPIVPQGGAPAGSRAGFGSSEGTGPAGVE